jgi:hypothetical protein
MKPVFFTRVLLVLLFIIPILVVGSFVKTGINGYAKARFEEMIEGTAYKPFAGRVLVPVVVKNLSRLVPASFSAQLDDWAKRSHPQLTADKPEIGFTHLLISAIIWYISIIGFSFSLMTLIRNFYETSDITTLIVAIISVSGIPVFFRYNSYAYDFMQLFLFTLCLYHLARSHWFRFIIFFSIVTLNKETSILLTFIYYLHFRNILSRRIYLRLLTIQIALYFAIRLAIHIALMANPGSIVEFHLLHNLSLDPYSLAQFLAFLCIGLLITYDWANKPTFIKDASVIMIPMVLLTLFFGLIDEYRDFYELYPIIILLVAHTVIKHMMRVPFVLRSEYVLTNSSPKGQTG